MKRILGFGSSGEQQRQKEEIERLNARLNESAIVTGKLQEEIAQQRKSVLLLERKNGESKDIISLLQSQKTALTSKISIQESQLSTLRSNSKTIESRYETLSRKLQQLSTEQKKSSEQNRSVISSLERENYELKLDKACADRKLCDFKSSKQDVNKIKQEYDIKYKNIKTDYDMKSSNLQLEQEVFQSSLELEKTKLAAIESTYKRKFANQEKEHALAIDTIIKEHKKLIQTYRVHLINAAQGAWYPGTKNIIDGMIHTCYNSDSGTENYESVSTVSQVSVASDISEIENKILSHGSRRTLIDPAAGFLRDITTSKNGQIQVQ